MKDQVLIIRGTLHWPKIVGKAVPYTGNPKYDKGPYWSVDVTPDAASRKLIDAAGISDKLKTPKGEKETRTETFLALRINENKADGEKNRPPKISNIRGEPWGEDKIGNESIADIKVKVKDYGQTVGVYLQEVRVLRHVPYEGASSMPALSEDDEFFAAAEAGPVADTPDPEVDEEDEDDVPF